MAYIKFIFKEKEYQIDRFLANTLNSLIYNVRNDWDFVILVTGDRSVRVGKSVMAMQICAYLAYLLERLKLNKDAFSLDNIYFDSQKIMDEAPHLPQHSVIQYDEGREGLAAIKAMRGFQQDLIDFFTECGQLNHLFVVVLPDFFDLKEDMAVARSEILVNVFRKEVPLMRQIFNDGVPHPIVRFDRGFFEFYNKRDKKKLYDIARAKHIKSYALVKPTFPVGSFPNAYTVGEEEYKAKKLDSLMRFKEKKEKQEDTVTKRYRKNRLFLLYYMKNVLKCKNKLLGQLMGGSDTNTIKIIRNEMTPDVEMEYKMLFTDGVPPKEELIKRMDESMGSKGVKEEEKEKKDIINDEEEEKVEYKEGNMGLNRGVSLFSTEKEVSNPNTSIKLGDVL